MPLRHCRAQILMLGLALTFVACAPVPEVDWAKINEVLATLESNLPSVIADSASRVLPPSAALGAELVANTSLGAVIGKPIRTPYASCDAFLGVPFAEPPVGPLRFNDTMPKAAWAPNVWNGTAWSAACPQRCELPPLNCPTVQNEDCLYLDIYTPVGLAASGNTAPVMYWMPGGRFEQGSAMTILYIATYIANHTNTVVVTTNYRLGILGQLFTSTNYNEGVTGNFATQDQLTGLRWLQANIRAFGGDPSAVTLAGQSAGAQSSAVLLTTPVARGLFHRAILESNPSTLGLHPTDVAAQYGTRFLRDAGCYPFSRECLLSASIDDILNAQTSAQQGTIVDKIFGFVGLFMPWTPVVDNRFVFQQPMTGFSDGNWTKVPLLWGTVSEEGRIFIWQAIEKPAPFVDYAGLLADVFGLIDGVRVYERYPLDDAEMSDSRNATAMMATDWVFACPLRSFSRMVTADQSSPSVFMYQFNHTMSFSVAAWGANYSMCYGHVCHGSELPFLFGYLGGLFKFTPEEEQLHQSLMGAWTNFIATGDPNNGPYSLSPAWPAYSQSTDENYEFATPANTVVTGLKSELCDFWDTIGYEGWLWE